jgi:hypothetical protein
MAKGKAKKQRAKAKGKGGKAAAPEEVGAEHAAGASFASRAKGVSTDEVHVAHLPAPIGGAEDPVAWLVPLFRSVCAPAQQPLWLSVVERPCGG